jgi:cytochrome subunit of sulfide dehydrogenase
MTPQFNSPIQRFVVALGVAVLAAFPIAAFAQNTGVDAGRYLAAACAACHGTNGHSVYSMAALAGMPRTAMVQKMQGFSSGAVSATVMQQIARGYTERQIDLIAAFFAAQRPATRPHADNAAWHQQ